MFERINQRLAISFFQKGPGRQAGHSTHDIAVKDNERPTSTPIDQVAAAPAESRAATAQPRAYQLSLETGLYLLIGLLAVVTRFWDLTSRAMNHDESLHTYYSWIYYDSFQYVHDPLMHGPALFHMNALAYFLFGDNDYTSRIVPALFGVAIVLMPALLRSPRLLGRWGSLAASALLLFSPSILYYNRFIRHDTYALFAAFAIAICALRYIEAPRRRWLVMAGLFTGFLFCTKEVSFIVAFVMVTFLVAIVAWQVDQLLIGIAAATAVAAGAVVLGLRWMGIGSLPEIPWEDPTQSNIQQFAVDLLTHPVILAVIGVFGFGIVLCLMVIDRRRTPDGRWLDDVLGTTPGHSTAYTLYMALRDRRGMQLAVLTGLGLFVVLYTSLFTNMGGLGSATFGALGYWLGQQDVQRGAQPWYYYLILMPQYEFIAVAVFPFAALITLTRFGGRLRETGYPFRGPVGGRTYLRMFLLYWAVVMLVVLSWAGEKMPWLSVHITLPMLLLAASYTGEAIEYLEARVRAGLLPRGALALTVAGIPVISASSFLLWAWGTAGPYEFVNGSWNRTLQPTIQDNPWLLYVPLLAFVVFGLYLLVKLGSRTAFAAVGATLVGVILIAQAHVAYRFTYEEGDVAIDMMMYSQVSPDVPRAMEDIGELSRLTTGGKELSIWYDSGVSWPFQWYLRDYPNRRFYGTTISNPPDADIILIATENLRITDAEDNVTQDNAAMLSGYTYQQYSMRWFFPEDTTYRRFAIAPELNSESKQNLQTDEPVPYSLADVAESVWSSIWSLHEPEQQGEMFRLLAYRELWVPITSSYDFRVYVRNDLVDLYDEVRY